jgi:UDP-N-acetylglucosamine transferase subunit ALG13
VTEDRTSPTRPRVFVTVGTDHHPFDRLIDWTRRWLARNPGADVFIQSGSTAVPRGTEGEAFLGHREMAERIETATCAVCHGGPGTIMAVLDSGKKPIVVPRRSSLGEHVDDHQVRFTARLADSGLIVLAEDEGRFDDALDGAIAGTLDLTVPPREERLGPTLRRVGDLLDGLLLEA